jgi:hypothetical protein
MVALRENRRIEEISFDSSRHASWVHRQPPTSHFLVNIKINNKVF